MITFPIAKINLGLNVVEKRADGYHNLETVFYPVNIQDALEVYEMDETFPSPCDCDLKVTNIHIEGDEQRNLVVRAYQLLKQDFPSLPRLHAHLYKGIPTQAGMGGGSSDCGYMITLLNRMFQLGLSDAQMISYAARLGADCAFFITAEPSYATGRGEILEPADGPKGNLHGYSIVVVKPDVAVSTRDAYAQIVCHMPRKSCRDIVRQPISTWRDELTNDFEGPVFKAHPELARIKQSLYDMGALYAQMSGSGSALYGIFREIPQGVEDQFKGCFMATAAL